MDIKSFPVKINEVEARKIALEKGGMFWRMVFSKLPVTEIRDHFIEFKLITFMATHKPSLVERLLFKKSEIKKQKVTMLADGSTGSISWVESMPEAVIMKGIDELKVQKSDKENDYLVSRGRRIATQVLHRHVGGVPELEVVSIETVYRPYWIAFYGDVIEGKRVRYKPIPADGCGSHRTR